MGQELNIDHSRFKDNDFPNRYTRHADLKGRIEQIGAKGIFEVKQVGSSVQQREIYQLSIGNGKIQVMLWSQMHGDEPTATLAFLDVFNFFQADDEYNPVRKQILENCTLHFIPMLNPDGAMAYQRRNAQGIDLNRDFLNPQSPEAKLLVRLQQEIKPEFGFNMHDQETLWSVTGTKKPAAISLSAPPPDEGATVPQCRYKAMQVISSIFEMISAEIPGHIGRWQEEYEPRSFGDNFQALGVATILVESGGYPLDYEKQYVRKLNFGILIHALKQIATIGYTDRDTNTYYSIPFNNKALFHILLKNCTIQSQAGAISVDLGLNYSETFDIENQSSSKTYTLVDIGDLSTWNAYDIIDAKGAEVPLSIAIDAKADFKVADGSTVLIEFREGILIHKKKTGFFIAE